MNKKSCYSPYEFLAVAFLVDWYSLKLRTLSFSIMINWVIFSILFIYFLQLIGTKKQRRTKCETHLCAQGLGKSTWWCWHRPLWSWCWKHRTASWWWGWSAWPPRLPHPGSDTHSITKQRTRIKGILGGYFLVLHTTLLHLRFHCVGGYCDLTQDCCEFNIGSQTL